MIGPAGSWGDAAVTADVPLGATVVTSVLGITRSGEVDTLITRLSGASIDLGMISAQTYPKIQLFARLQANAQGDSPSLREWRVNATPPAELALNYQSVSLSSNRIIEGGQIIVSAAIHNVGYLSASDVRVAIEMVGRSGRKALDTLSFSSIVPGGSATSTVPISTAGFLGMNTLNIVIDPHAALNEIYRANNFYSASFFVEGDTVAPSLDVTFDGERIMDGDYVSARPEIRVTVRDNSPLPIADPAHIVLKLDGRRVTLGTHPDSLFEQGSGSDKARILFKPLLASGDHVLSVQVRDATGNPSDSTAGVIHFRTERESHLRNVVTIPNPMRRSTAFTFNLVGYEIPEQLSIKIYSVAGRMVNEFTVPRSALRIGFNTVPWEARDTDGNPIANGVYFYKLSYRLNGKLVEVVEKLAKVE